MEEKPVYRTFNFFKLLGVWIIRIFFLCIILSAILNFNENPVVITIIVIVLIFATLYIGQISVVVFKDRFEYNYGSLIPILARKRKFYYKDIKTLSIDGNFTQTFDLLVDIPLDNFVFTPWNSLDIEFKDGKKTSISTEIYKGDLQKALKYISAEFRNFNKSSLHQNDKKSN